MSDFTSVLQRPQKIVICPWMLPHPLGESVWGSRLTPPTTAGAWPVANRAIFMPFFVEVPMTIFQLAIYNGAVAGEVDIGVYSYPGTGTSATRLTSAGKTAMAGENVIQTFNTADITINPGTYFLGTVCSTVTTATFRRSTPSLPINQVGGVLQQNLAEPVLPSTATLARIESSFFPGAFAIGRATL